MTVTPGNPAFEETTGGSDQFLRVFTQAVNYDITGEGVHATTDTPRL